MWHTLFTHFDKHAALYETTVTLAVAQVKGGYRMPLDDPPINEEFKKLIEVGSYRTPVQWVNQLKATVTELVRKVTLPTYSNPSSSAFSLPPAYAFHPLLFTAQPPQAIFQSLAPLFL